MIATYILDEALACIANDASRLDICSEMPKLYADVARLSIGHKSVPAVSSPENCEGGRMVVVASIEDGTVTRAGTPTYWPDGTEPHSSLRTARPEIPRARTAGDRVHAAIDPHQARGCTLITQRNKET